MQTSSPDRSQSGSEHWTHGLLGHHGEQQGEVPDQLPRRRVLLGLVCSLWLAWRMARKGCREHALPRNEHGRSDECLSHLLQNTLHCGKCVKERTVSSRL